MAVCEMQQIGSETNMGSDYVTWDEISLVREENLQTGMVGDTPLLKHMQYVFKDLSEKGVDLYLKLENMQNTGSFKIRGVVNQVRKLIQSGQDPKFLTMSAGNYGSSFAYVLNAMGKTGLCVMPDTAPQSKADFIRNMGVEVERALASDLKRVVDEHVQERGYHFCHPFDDRDLIAGYGTIGQEILAELPKFDVLLICCGGGGLASGISAAVRAKLGDSCKIYAVEPQGSATMRKSFENNRAMADPDVKSVAAGLSPPYVGKLTYDYCRRFVDDVLLVSDAEIIEAMTKLFQAGLKVEPSGCAGMAALLSNKVPDVNGKRVVVIISGGNVSVGELKELMAQNIT